MFYYCIVEHQLCYTLTRSQYALHVLLINTKYQIQTKHSHTPLRTVKVICVNDLHSSHEGLART